MLAYHRPATVSLVGWEGEGEGPPPLPLDPAFESPSVPTSIHLALYSTVYCFMKLVSYINLLLNLETPCFIEKISSVLIKQNVLYLNSAISDMNKYFSAITRMKY